LQQLFNLVSKAPRLIGDILLFRRPATGLTSKGHIFAAEAGDYYHIDDGLPKSAGWGLPLDVDAPRS
jgi:hypothetical protein